MRGMTSSLTTACSPTRPPAPRVQLSGPTTYTTADRPARKRTGIKTKYPQQYGIFNHQADDAPGDSPFDLYRIHQCPCSRMFVDALQSALTPAGEQQPAGPTAENGATQPRHAGSKPIQRYYEDSSRMRGPWRTDTRLHAGMRLSYVTSTNQIPECRSRLAYRRSRQRYWASLLDSGQRNPYLRTTLTLPCDAPGPVEARHRMHPR